MSSLPSTIPYQEPQTLAAGDDATWIRQLNDFSANSFTLNYVLQGPKIIKFQASNDTGLFLVELTNAITLDWTPGLYRMSAYVASISGTRVQRQVRTAYQRFLVTPNVAVSPNGASPASFAERALPQIEATILALTSRTVAQASVNGQVYTLQNITDLFLLRERFKSEVRREEEQARLNAGMGASNKIGIRFRPLTWVGYPNPQAPLAPWQ